MLSYDAELKKLRKLGQVLNNSIVVARLLFEIITYILPILVLLEVLNTPENYVAALKNIFIVVCLVELRRRKKLLIENKSSPLPFSPLSIKKNEVLLKNERIRY